MIAAVFLTAAAGLLRKNPSFLQRDEVAFGLDPHCAQGIGDTTLTYCCQKDCGECSDASDVCEAKATNGRGSTCCPSDMQAQPSCEHSMAPCVISAAVRADTSAEDLQSADGVRNALDDCNEAKPDEAARQLVATHFVKFEGQKPKSATTKDCSARALEVAAATCDKDDECLGMTTDAAGDFACFLVATAAVQALEADATSTYLKRSGSAGQTYHYQTSLWEPDADCKSFCKATKDHIPSFSAEGGSDELEGKLTRDVTCLSSQKETMPIGMCSLQVAMNEDAYPNTEIACNCAKALPWLVLHAGKEIDHVEACKDTVPKEVTQLMTKDFCFHPMAPPILSSMRLKNELNEDCTLTSVIEDPEGGFSWLTGLDLGNGFTTVGNIVEHEVSEADGLTEAELYLEVDGLPWAQSGQAYGTDLFLFEQSGPERPFLFLELLSGEWLACEDVDAFLAVAMKK